MEYTVNYFIKKFEVIPENRWCIGALHNTSGKFCALGHCGAQYDYKLEGEAKALHDLFKNLRLNIYTVNDFITLPQYPQKTPKKRILAALWDVKTLEAVGEAENILRKKELFLI